MTRLWTCNAIIDWSDLVLFILWLHLYSAIKSSFGLVNIDTTDFWRFSRSYQFLFSVHGSSLLLVRKLVNSHTPKFLQNTCVLFEPNFVLKTV